MFNLTIEGRDMAEFRAAVFALAEGLGYDVKPEKQLRDFPLQDVVEYVRSFKGTDEPPAEKKATKKAAPAAPVEVTGDGEELREEAVKRIMAVYGEPGGKTLVAKLLNTFGVKKFHDIPAERNIEFHNATMAALESMEKK